MSNELLWLVFLVCEFLVSLIAIRLFGKSALYMMIIFGIIFCNIQVLKLVNLFGFVVTLGNIIYGSIFLATDLLCECYGKKEAQKAVLLGLFSLIIFTLGMMLTLQFSPSLADLNHSHLKDLFQYTPRIVLASIVAYAISQSHDVWMFSFLKRKTSGKHLWLRNNASTLLSQLIDTGLFVFIAFYRVYNFEVVMAIAYTTLIFKWITALLDTPVVYLGKRILKKYHFQDS